MTHDMDDDNDDGCSHTSSYDICSYDFMDIRSHVGSRAELTALPRGKIGTAGDRLMNAHRCDAPTTDDDREYQNIPRQNGTNCYFEERSREVRHEAGARRSMLVEDRSGV